MKAKILRNECGKFKKRREIVYYGPYLVAESQTDKPTGLSCDNSKVICDNAGTPYKTTS